MLRDAEAERALLVSARCRSLLRGADDVPILQIAQHDMRHELQACAPVRCTGHVASTG
jgi:hypothetical protein